MPRQHHGSRTLTRRDVLKSGAALAAGATLVGRVSASPVAAQQLPRNETLNIAGFQWGPPTTFNPLNASPAWPASGQLEFIYETLFGFNILNGQLEPLLAKSIASPDKTTIAVTLHDGIKWQDGQPLTADDVIYTLTLPQRVQGLSYGTLFDYITKVEAPDATTVKLTLNADQLNPGMVKNLLSGVHIVPKHIWEPREKDPKGITNVVETKPIGSGPYTLQSFSPERVALTRDDNYWGNTTLGKPAPKYVVHPIFKAADGGNLALQRGEVDLSQQFVPQIWEMWEKRKSPVGTWLKDAPYYIPGSIPLLFININKKPLDNPKVRLALAYAINYPQIAETAMSRYSTPANASLIIPTGSEEQYFDEGKVKANGWTYDPARAKQILEEELKATKKDGVYVLPDGTRIGPFKAQCPYGWTDWMTSLQLVSQSAKAAGIDISTEFPEAPVVTTAVQSGDFDFAVWFVAGASAAGPWQRFRDVLDNRGVPKVGQKAFWNYNRYTNATVGPLLDKAAAAAAAEQKQLYTRLDDIFRSDVPAIPLMYRPDEFYEFNESHWTGFPTEATGDGVPMHRGAGIKNLRVIKPAASS